MELSIAGIDEAGRGPLAGRVYAACVILNNVNIKGLKDSKKLTPQKRQVLFDIIVKNAISYGIAYATPIEIDSINILQATFLAMRRAYEIAKIGSHYVMVDGNFFPFKECNGEAVIKGDTLIQEIMAASILAKVSRDNYMEEMHKIYPQYNFEKHKGYPTKEHKELLIKHGVSDIHRKTFKGVKELLL